MKVILKFACNAVIGMCLGSFIDHFADTGYLFAIIGLVAGIGVSFLLKAK